MLVRFVFVRTKKKKVNLSIDLTAMALLGQGTRKSSWQRSFIRHFSTEHLHKAQVVHPKLSVPFVKNRREAVLNARYDAIVIGGGHNGLTAAAYLAKAKKKATKCPFHCCLFQQSSCAQEGLLSF